MGNRLWREVIDGLPRPPGPDGTIPPAGVDSYRVWSMHESLYQVLDARYVTGDTGESWPPRDFTRAQERSARPAVYLGLGHKRDQVSERKHWGDANYVALIREMKRLMPELEVWTSGSPHDILGSISTVKAGIRNPNDLKLMAVDIMQSIRALSQCWLYVGNDTGMMHVASSFDIPSVVLFGYEGLSTKNPPTAPDSQVLEFWRDAIDPVTLAADVVRRIRAMSEHNA
jgi:ADP-heptose:LPS heptosyltransferase